MALKDFALKEFPPPLDGYENWMRSLKDDLVASTTEFGVGRDDLTPRVEFWRDGNMVATVICQDVSRDEALQAAWIGVPGFAADEVRLLLETHVTDQKFIEKYGRTPDPHELQHLCDNEGACDLGLTTDALILLRVTRDQKVAQGMLPYHVNATAKQVHWQPDVSFVAEDDDPANGFAMKGIVPDSLRSFFEKPLAIDAAREDGVMPEEYGIADEAQRHVDMAMVRILTHAGYAVVVASQPDEEGFVNESLRRAGVGGIGPDGERFDRDTDYEPTMLDVMAEMLGAKLKRERDRQHRLELQEAARLRAARGEGPVMNREQRRAAARKR